MLPIFGIDGGAVVVMVAEPFVAGLLEDGCVCPFPIPIFVLWDGSMREDDDPPP